jgi:MoaA/NifB/PqqE/SkfB family radical SAM enzyme
MRQFKRVYIEITNKCNASCRFCPKTSRAPGFMGKDLFSKILNEIEGYSEHLYFHVMGEPLLHPDIGLFLDLCGKKGFKVHITTNGTLIKQTKHVLLSKPCIRAMNFSLQVLDESTPIKDVDEYLDEVLAFIDDLGKNPGLICCLRLWNLENRRIHAHAGAAREETRNRYIFKRIEKFFGLARRIEEIPSAGNGICLRGKIYLSQRSVFDWPDKRMPDMGGEGFCLGLRQQVAILVDGTVVPCCLDNDGLIDLGNINTHSFKQIIEGKRAIDIYNGFSERKAVEALCRKCGFRKRFDLDFSGPVLDPQPSP